MRGSMIDLLPPVKCYLGVFGRLSHAASWVAGAGKIRAAHRQTYALSWYVPLSVSWYFSNNNSQAHLRFHCHQSPPRNYGSDQAD